MRRALSIAALTALVFVSTRGRAAADDWIEVKSAHFTVVSNAGERTTRRLVWQLEQVRSATSTLFAWAKADLVKPLRVVVVKDENSMRVWAPQVPGGPPRRPPGQRLGERSRPALHGDPE